MFLALTRTLLPLVCLTLLLLPGFADTIKLKNGSVIKGKVIVYNEREFTVYLDLGSSTKRTTSRMVIAVEDVESIQFDTDVSLNAANSQSGEGSARTTTKEPVTREIAKPTPSPSISTPASDAQTGGSGEPALAEKTVSVVAAADWTSTEIRVRKGQRISITASGQIDLGNGRRSSPEGTTISDPKKLLLNSPTGALIAVIG
ncbi:MAG TPA: hypothetical protein VFZ34_29625, partial [Blastocatellia bacterium]|nr:hypothetical protein [Blastocatellia bacterium]